MSEIETRLWEASILIPADLLLDSPLPETVWRPPPPGRFTQLDSRDECWARPLGLGKVVPLSQIFEEIKERCDRKILEMLNVPSALFAERLTNYRTARLAGR